MQPYNKAACKYLTSLRTHVEPGLAQFGMPRRLKTQSYPYPSPIFAVQSSSTYGHHLAFFTSYHHGPSAKTAALALPYRTTNGKDECHEQIIALDAFRALIVY